MTTQNADLDADAVAITLQIPHDVYDAIRLDASDNGVSVHDQIINVLRPKSEAIIL